MSFTFREKVILISIDGMRPDGLLACGNPFVSELMKLSSYTLEGRTVFPSVTLPCHMSMFHSVTPQRHGILTNTFAPMVRPLPGIFEQIRAFGGKSDLYYGWQPLRDIAGPKTLCRHHLIACNQEEDSDTKLTDLTLKRIEEGGYDFIFLYQPTTDDTGHSKGWMGEAYLRCLSTAVDNVRRVYEAAGHDHTLIITADHGGHDRSHGSELDEDMTIPLFFLGKDFTPGKKLEGVSILDLAPTIARVMGFPTAEEWEGKSLLD